MTRTQTRIADHDDRRARRKAVDSDEPVTNVITGEIMGRIGNISRTGMLLICPSEPRSSALYQCRLPLSADGEPMSIEVGLQEQWHQPSDTADHFWAGFRIIAMRDEDNARLQAWLERSD